MKTNRRIGSAVLLAALLLSTTVRSSLLASETVPPTKSVALASQVNLAGPVTLDDAIAVAKVNHGSVKSAVAGVLASLQRVRQLKTGTLPSVNGNVFYFQTGGRTIQQSTGAYVSGSGTAGVQPEVGLTYKISDSGLTSARVRQAKANLSAFEAGLGAVRNDLSLFVADAFYNQLRAQKLLDLRKEQVRLSEEQLKSVDARIEVGSAAAADRAMPLSDLRNRQVDQIQSQNDLAVAANSLRNQMGLPTGAALNLTETLVPMEVQASLDELHADALAARPEALSAEVSVRAAKEGIRIARIDRKPKLDTSVVYLYTPRGRTQRDHWEVGGNVSMPLFDSGLTHAQEEEAKANMVAAEADLEQVKKDIAAEVTEAYNNLISARERVTASDAAAEAARVSLQQTTERYTLGASGASVVALIQAQVQFATASNSAIQAEYDLRLARVQLDRALGSLR